MQTQQSVQRWLVVMIIAACLGLGLLIGALVYQIVAQLIGFNQQQSIITSCNSYINYKLSSSNIIYQIAFVFGCFAALCLILIIMLLIIQKFKAKSTLKQQMRAPTGQQVAGPSSSQPIGTTISQDKFIILYFLCSFAVLGLVVHFGLILNIFISQIQCQFSISVPLLVISILSGISLLLSMLLWIFVIILRCKMPRPSEKLDSPQQKYNPDINGQQIKKQLSQNKPNQVNNMQKFSKYQVDERYYQTELNPNTARPLNEDNMKQQIKQPLLNKQLEMVPMPPASHLSESKVKGEIGIQTYNFIDTQNLKKNNAIESPDKQSQQKKGEQVKQPKIETAIQKTVDPGIRSKDQQLGRMTKLQSLQQENKRLMSQLVLQKQIEGQKQRQRLSARIVQIEKLQKQKQIERQKQKELQIQRLKSIEKQKQGLRQLQMLRLKQKQAKQAQQQMIQKQKQKQKQTNQVGQKSIVQESLIKLVKEIQSQLSVTNKQISKLKQTKQQELAYVKPQQQQRLTQQYLLPRQNIVRMEQLQQQHDLNFFRYPRQNNASYYRDQFKMMANVPRQKYYNFPQRQQRYGNPYLTPQNNALGQSQFRQPMWQRQTSVKQLTKNQGIYGLETQKKSVSPSMQLPPKKKSKTKTVKKKSSEQEKKKKQQQEKDKEQKAMFQQQQMMLQQQQQLLLMQMQQQIIQSGASHGHKVAQNRQQRSLNRSRAISTASKKQPGNEILQKSKYGFGQQIKKFENHNNQSIYEQLQESINQHKQQQTDYKHHNRQFAETGNNQFKLQQHPKRQQFSNPPILIKEKSQVAAYEQLKPALFATPIPEIEKPSIIPGPFIEKNIKQSRQLNLFKDTHRASPLQQSEVKTVQLTSKNLRKSQGGKILKTSISQQKLKQQQRKYFQSIKLVTSKRQILPQSSSSNSQAIEFHRNIRKSLQIKKNDESKNYKNEIESVDKPTEIKESRKGQKATLIDYIRSIYTD